MSSITECTQCAEGPSGFEGHAALQLLPIRRGEAEASFLLRCRNCGTEWQRRFTREGVKWLRAFSSKHSAAG